MELQKPALSSLELTKLLIHAVELGTSKAIEGEKSIPTLITKMKAYRLYGRSIVNRWLQEGLITLVSNRDSNTPKYFSRIELERVSAQSNRTTYLSVEER